MALEKRQLFRYAPSEVPVGLPAKEPTRWDNMPPKPSISHEHDEQCFHIHNVGEEQAVDVKSKTLKFKVLKSEDRAGEYRVQYDGDGNKHKVSVKVDGESVTGTPFTLAPQEPEVEHVGSYQFLLKNAYDPDAVNIQTDTLPYEMSPTGKKAEFIVNHIPGANGGTHNVQVAYKGEPVKNGNFRLYPDPEKERERQAAAMRHQQQQLAALGMMAHPYAAVPPQMMYVPHQPVAYYHQQPMMAMAQHPSMVPMIPQVPIHSQMMQLQPQIQQQQLQQQSQQVQQQQQEPTGAEKGSAIPFQPRGARAGGPPMFKPPY